MKRDYDQLKEIVQPGVFKRWQEVDIVVCDTTDLGLKVIINDEYLGVVYSNEIYDYYENGQALKAFIKFIRPDGKIDVSLQPEKGDLVFVTTQRILKELKAKGGNLALNDKSSPQEIKDKFKISKKSFKQAIGVLYKQRKIIITDKGIELVK